MFKSANNALDMRETYRGPDLRIFVKDVRDRGRKRALTVRSWSTVKDVKDVLQQILQVPPSSQRLYFGPLMTSGGELPNHRSLHDAGIYRSGETLLLEIKGAAYAGISPSSASISSLCDSALSDVCVSSVMIDQTPKSLRVIVQEARRGLNLGLKPELVLDGSGGTYFLHDARKVKVAVFKPADEEPYAQNNPRGYVKQGGLYCEESLRAGICPGEACLREVAAYLLDHDGFSGVPMTTLAEARHPAFNTNGAMLKVSEGGAAIGSHALGSNTHAADEKAKKFGSFQEFVKAECTIDDMSPSKMSVDEVHKIAILDIRIMNADRNSANLLCRRKQDNTFELVPIDHGYCLRSVCDVSWMDWCWLDWPQLKEPLSEKSRKYILELDIDADAQLLKDHFNIPSKALDYFRASSKLLQAGVKAGLSLYDIAVMCCRNDDLGEVQSKLEVLTSMASELATSAVENGRWHHATACKALAEQLSPDGGSLLSCSSHTESPRMPKSASSVNFSSFFTDTSELAAAEMARNDAPPMMQSSASDSSSDVGDAAMDREEREEWAAGIVADVSMSSIDFKSLAAARRKRRSHSTDSDDSSGSGDSNLSSSPVGFWYTRPGSAGSVCDESDDDSWSPHIAPRDTVEINLSPRNSLKVTCIPAYDEKDSLNEASATEDEEFRSPTVKFFESWSGVLLPPPATVNVTSFKSTDASSSKDVPADESNSVLSVLRKTPSMARSQSFSAFSALRSSSIDSVSSGERGFVSDNDQFRTYFAKFVDLVIVRETTAASY